MLNVHLSIANRLQKVVLSPRIFLSISTADISVVMLRTLCTFLHANYVMLDTCDPLIVSHSPSTTIKVGYAFHGSTRDGCLKSWKHLYGHSDAVDKCVFGYFVLF